MPKVAFGKLRSGSTEGGCPGPFFPLLDRCELSCEPVEGPACMNESRFNALFSLEERIEQLAIKATGPEMLRYLHTFGHTGFAGR